MRVPLTVLVLFMCAGASAQCAPEPPATPDKPTEVANAKPVILRLENGKVSADLQAKWIRLPAEVCLGAGAEKQDAFIEFLAFFQGGEKDHESAFRVLCKPDTVNLLMLGMGLRDASDQVKKKGAANRPKGDEVLLEVEWVEKDGTKRRERAEYFLKNKKLNKPMVLTPWVFTGGQYYEVTNRDGRKVTKWNGIRAKLLAAVFRDPNAILNNPLPVGADDESIVLHGERMLPTGTKVTLIISVAPPAKKAVKKEND